MPEGRERNGDDAAASDGDGTDGYEGVFGAFPYAVRTSESLVFRSYAVVGGFVAALVSLLFALGVVVLLGDTGGASGGSFTFSRAFFVFVGFLTVAPLLAPVLLVARRHRREGTTPGHDARVGAAGYLFLASLYVGMLAVVPAEYREPVAGPHAPVVELLYSLPPAAGALPPVLGVVAIWLAARR